MQAIRVGEFGGPDVLGLEDVEELAAGEGQVLIRVKAAGVNPVDTYMRSGSYANLPEPPYTPGSDAAGVVQALGRGVRGLKEGDRVYTLHTLSGAYAEQVLCSPQQVFPLPDNVSFAQGAALGVPFTTAYRALFHKGAARPGEVLLVHGATGGVGLAAVQLARAAGLEVVATGGSEAGRRLALDCGARHALDHGEDSHLERIPELLDGRRPDLILEMLANRNLGRDLSALAPRGRVVVIGSRGTVEINPRDLMMRDASIHGMLLGNIPAEGIREIHAALGAGLEAATLRPVVSRTLPLAEAAEAHRLVMEEGHQGNIVLQP